MIEVIAYLKFTVHEEVPIVAFGVLNLNSQSYFPFPTDTVQWKSMVKQQESADDIWYHNSRYLLQGDTTHGGQAYKKLFYQALDGISDDQIYIGGIREDDEKNIYFFPVVISVPKCCGLGFFTHADEYLLYTFKDLVPGMTLSLNEGATEVTIIAVDSILIGDSYRSRYQIEQSELFSEGHYWIEGIGSTKDLLATFAFEFEWELYTLCFTDSTSYFVNSPDGEESCDDWSSTQSIDSFEDRVEIYPNPASQSLFIKSKLGWINGIVEIHNIKGQSVFNGKINESELEIDIESLESGIYFVEIISSQKREIIKFVKN